MDTTYRICRYDLDAVRPHLDRHTAGSRRDQIASGLGSRAEAARVLAAWIEAQRGKLDDRDSYAIEEEDSNE